MEQLAKANTNPEEINIGDSDEDESAKVEGMYRLLPSHITLACPHLQICVYLPSLPTHRGSFGAADHSKCSVWFHSRGDPRGGLGGKTETGHEEEGTVENGGYAN